MSKIRSVRCVVFVASTAATALMIHQPALAQSPKPLTIVVAPESPNTLLGNPTGVTGPPMEITLGNCSFSDNVLYCPGKVQTSKPQDWTAAQAFQELHTTTYAPTLVNNNYNVSVNDCGKILQIADSNTATVTVPNLSPPNNDCVITIEQTGVGNVVPRAAPGAVLTPNVNNFTKTKGPAAFISVVLRTPGTSASVWDWTGDGQ